MCSVYLSSQFKSYLVNNTGVGCPHQFCINLYKHQNDRSVQSVALLLFLTHTWHRRTLNPYLVLVFDFHDNGNLGERNLQILNVVQLIIPDC